MKILFLLMAEFFGALLNFAPGSPHPSPALPTPLLNIRFSAVHLYIDTHILICTQSPVKYILVCSHLLSAKALLSCCEVKKLYKKKKVRELNIKFLITDFRHTGTLSLEWFLALLVLCRS